MKDERLVLKSAGSHADPTAEQFRDYVDLKVRDESGGCFTICRASLARPTFRFGY